MKYIYSDGVGNTYTLTKLDPHLSTEHKVAHLHYHGLTPMESCSGRYSGGPDVDRDLSPSEWEEVGQRIRALEAATAKHAPQRNKGTGIFTIKEDDHSKRSFIVRMDALSEIEAFMRQLKSSTPY
ncbi:hypothetical protein QOT17_002595 [Balamuthia mandrillaris]